jgi:hypothetical protein
MRNRLVALFSVIFLSAVIATGQERVIRGASPQSPAQAGASGASVRAEVLVLGVYHMANPGHDIFNMKADDVLAPKRQAEMAQLIEVLKKFQPTKIAIEANYGTQRVAQEYSDYLAGKYTLSRNEIDQIGYRLAKELGHKSVFPVDVDGEFPYQHLVNFAKASGRSKELDAVMAGWGEMAKAQNAYLASHTILETLVFTNADDRVATDVGLYYQAAQFGEPYDWAGADLLADWFRRNMRIYSNIAQIVESPNERVLVIFGAGHLGWLRHSFASNPNFRLRKLAEFVK